MTNIDQPPKSKRGANLPNWMKMYQAEKAARETSDELAQQRLVALQELEGHVTGFQEADRMNHKTIDMLRNSLNDSRQETDNVSKELRALRLELETQKKKLGGMRMLALAGWSVGVVSLLVLITTVS